MTPFDMIVVIVVALGLGFCIDKFRSLKHRLAFMTKKASDLQAECDALRTQMLASYLAAIRDDQSEPTDRMMPVAKPVDPEGE